MIILAVLCMIVVAIVTLASYDPDAASRWIMITSIGGVAVVVGLLVVAILLARREWRRGHADVVRDYRSKPDDTPEIWGSGTSSKMR